MVGTSTGHKVAPVSATASLINSEQRQGKYAFVYKKQAFAETEGYVLY